MLRPTTWLLKHITLLQLQVSRLVYVTYKSYIAIAILILVVLMLSHKQLLAAIPFIGVWIDTYVFYKSVLQKKT